MQLPSQRLATVFVVTFVGALVEGLQMLLLDQPVVGHDTPVGETPGAGALGTPHHGVLNGSCTHGHF